MLYLSSLFQLRYPEIFNELNTHIDINQIANTNDIWIRDFMPIKNTDNEWVLFKYKPKYLRNPKYRTLISDNQTICKNLGLKYTYYEIILDGGSVVYQDDLYFISERILADNPAFKKSQIIQNLEEIFKTDRIILLPEVPNDFTGHLDGVLSILDDRSILINEYQEPYKHHILNILEKQNFNIETLAYNPYNNKTYQSAKGVYINFIKTDERILVPMFQQMEDELAINKLEQLFPKHDITPILCDKLAKAGGLLHCVSWEDK